MCDATVTRRRDAVALGHRKDLGDTVYDPQQALVPMSTTTLNANAAVELSPATMFGLGLATVLAVGSFLNDLPLLGISVIVIAGVSTLAADTADAPRHARSAEDEGTPIAPEMITSLAIRTTYRATLHAYVELQQRLSQAPHLRSGLQPALERCRTAVVLCSRMALLANPLQRYLDHASEEARTELERLRARTEATRDDQVIAALAQAAAARVRQLLTVEQIEAMRDRIHARIELVRAALESFAATVVRQHVADEEAMDLASDGSDVAMS